ncbi:hypothetical protein [Clostridium massiliamazoniense]|uniref:hypothetical protein n=1 Tax=Clostridium massiliamazoniense TaxID=1347366 RepID=UPI0006D79171|nr:hypothetical protein [Clostridium massiliamazoniense]
MLNTNNYIIIEFIGFGIITIFVAITIIIEIKKHINFLIENLPNIENIKKDLVKSINIIDEIAQAIVPNSSISNILNIIDKLSEITISHVAQKYSNISTEQLIEEVTEVIKGILGDFNIKIPDDLLIKSIKNKINNSDILDNSITSNIVNQNRGPKG